MARKKPARSAPKKAKTKAAPKAAARKAPKKAGRKVVKTARKGAKPLKKAARRAVAAKAAAPKKARTNVKKAFKKVFKKVFKKAKRSAVTAKAVKAGVTAALTPPKARAWTAKKPNLDRPRKTVADIHGIPSSWGRVGAATAAQTGRAELKEKLSKNTNTSPALAAGDVDADWQSAESSGDETPGGNNPTPGQDVVDEIGRALGVEYADDEELQGGAEIADRDRHRWELDPSSKDDFDEKD